MTAFLSLSIKCFQCEELFGDLADAMLHMQTHRISAGYEVVEKEDYEEIVDVEIYNVSFTEEECEEVEPTNKAKALEELLEQPKCIAVPLPPKLHFLKL